MPQVLLPVEVAFTGTVWAGLACLMLLHKPSRAAGAWVGFAVLLDAALAVACMLALLAPCIPTIKQVL